jgi:phosphopantetheine--protein transferase-like protein
MQPANSPRARCGTDTVDLGRMARWLEETPEAELRTIFSAAELADAGSGRARVASLAARFAAREACMKLLPRETALGALGPADFQVARDGYGAPRVELSPRTRAALDRYRLDSIALSLSHDERSACAVAITEPASTVVPAIGRLVYRLAPIRRRVVLANLRRVFAGRTDEAEITRLAQAFYAHAARSLIELVRFALLDGARRRELVRVENAEAMLRAAERGRGILVLTGHFGNWEIATVAGITSFPQYRGRFHFVRRPLTPGWLDRLVAGRFRRAGLGLLPKRGALDRILDRLAANEAVVFALDQHAGGRDGVAVDFFGTPALTFRSLALIALASRAPVVPAASWREPGGRHVLRFEEPLATIEEGDPDHVVRCNTRAYNEALERLVLRHPEQWFWMHRRWKSA